ncbi:ammonium transporter [Acetobacter vaccinii]|uniref:Ammonium transporter n=1 Tax=Acetobacter vaccinii TaxID=2592655 RepID=A0A5C1YML6_9PROT|nr:ammonium transporter [Acetobacter vaccinii]QEO17536.1 ammonium transporter [Acetobacter vaccinii]
MLRSKKGLLRAAGILTSLAAPVSAFAQDAAAKPAYGLPDTAYIATCALFVMLMMLPGLALFYGGMSRSKNVLSVLTQVFAGSCVVILLWTVVGYSLTFSPGPYQAVIGGLDKIFLRGVTPDGAVGVLPEYLYYFFMAMFAAITPPIIIGAFAERMRFAAVLVFLAVWFLIDYVPMAHMAWGGGWVADWGAQDFAGGNVVHMNAGVAALIASIMIGKRRGLGTIAMAPHDMTMTYTGGCMLFVGWLAFCGGCDYAVSGHAIELVINTMLGGVGGALGWMVMEWLHRGRPSTFGIVSGAVAGLVGITPACGFVSPAGSIAVGVLTSAACIWAVDNLKAKFGYDDAFDVFGIHGVGAMVGGVLTTIFALPLLGGAGYSNGRDMFSQMGVQIFIMGFSILVSIVATFIAMKAASLTGGLRVSDDEEEMGLDLSCHGETAYRINMMSGGEETII